ncbi:MAG TPA: hypothetical protein VF629_21305 [Hymenobacter sp.]|jgi:hypothetical protein|uniref:hypothetical protein n=1 Tax=Hymenobacter sp. TaxID=1898978 RepID=UPI002ED8B7E1
MKKVNVVFSLAVLLAGGLSLDANAVKASMASATSAKALYPDNDFFFYGLADGRAFGEAAAAQYGYRTPNFNAIMAAEIEQAQANAQASTDADDQYYWYGYKTGLQQRR